jgi:hypothetical protein
MLLHFGHVGHLFSYAGVFRTQRDGLPVLFQLCISSAPYYGNVRYDPHHLGAPHNFEPVDYFVSRAVMQNMNPKGAPWDWCMSTDRVAVLSLGRCSGSGLFYDVLDTNQVRT